MKSPVVKRSIVIGGHKTSVSLEEAFWRGLKDIAVTRHLTLSDLVGSIDTERKHGNLSSAIRLFVLSHYQVRPNGESTARPTSGREVGSDVGAPSVSSASRIANSAMNGGRA
jgi:predicted DNA-binding ribbon-helix-helix protein